MKGTVLRIASGGAVIALLMTVLAVPASADVPPAAAPKVSVADPAPGAFLRRGALWVDGVACDPNASQTDSSGGIARVQVFLGDRDTTVGTPTFRPGGLLGQATLSSLAPTFTDAAINSKLGLSNPDAATCRQQFAGWRVLTGSLRKGIFDMNVYVLAKNGKETKVTIPGIHVDIKP